MGKIIEKITSVHNQKIKNIVKLQKASERKMQNIFFVEGLKEIEKALLFGNTVVSTFFCSNIISLIEIENHFSKLLSTEIFEISQEVFNKISYRENSGGIIVLFEYKKKTLDDLKLKENPLIIVLDSVEKPGNIGAILRTADAAGIDAVLITGFQTDLYNPNVIRASLGCVFSVPIAESTVDEAIYFLQRNYISIYCTYLEASKVYSEIDFKKSSAIVMGTEATGISVNWLKNSNSNIIIPMRGIADSMNVSTSTAVVVYEACRQRNFK